MEGGRGVGGRDVLTLESVWDETLMRIFPRGEKKTQQKEIRKISPWAPASPDSCLVSLGGTDPPLPTHPSPALLRSDLSLL